MNYLPSGPDTHPGHVTSKTPRYSSSPFFTPRSRPSRSQPKTPASRREPIVHVLCSKPVDRSINTSISLASHPATVKTTARCLRRVFAKHCTVLPVKCIRPASVPTLSGFRWRRCFKATRGVTKMATESIPECRGRKLKFAKQAIMLSTEESINKRVYYNPPPPPTHTHTKK